MKEYEIYIEKAFPIYESERFKYVFVEADSVEDAKKEVRWIHGELIDIISVTEA